MPTTFAGEGAASGTLGMALGAIALGAEITFVKDDDGKVTKLLLRQGGRETEGKRVQ